MCVEMLELYLGIFGFNTCICKIFHVYISAVTNNSVTTDYTLKPGLHLLPHLALLPRPVT